MADFEVSELPLLGKADNPTPTLEIPWLSVRFTPETGH